MFKLRIIDIHKNVLLELSRETISVHVKRFNGKVGIDFG